jgi:aspartyl-tRNA(Asn)/glutamyl-tRNA(Gln) amidotransferase subunit A
VEDRWRAFITRVEPAGQGPRVAIKDLFDTAGVRTTYGSAIFRDHLPEQTAVAVERLEAAGYVSVGKANLHEFAYGITSENPHFGAVVNPRHPELTPGGSSGGSAAALAAGLCDVALGTDSAGSIRIPAACCGLVGFKPTNGLVPLDGCFPLAPSFDTVGPLAHSVDACVRAMAALAPELGAPVAVDLNDLRVGVAWLGEADRAVQEAVAAVARLFPRAHEVDLPLPEGTYPVFMRETAEVHRELFPAHRELYGENVRTKLDRCFRITDAEYETALAARARYAQAADGALGDLDLLLAPTLPWLPPPVGAPELELRGRMIRLTYPANHLGWPALALPVARSDGPPASVSLLGRAGADALVLGAGLALEPALAASSPV